MVASLLLIACLVELVCTVWCLARLKDFVRRIGVLESNVNRTAKVLADMATDGNDSAGGVLGDLTISQPTPAELQQAQDILSALGLGGLGTSSGNADDVSL